MIYFIGSGVRGPIKIGYTNDKDVSKRLISLQVGNPNQLVVLGLKEGGAQEEQRIHGLFKEHRLRYEWFERCGPILDFIRLTCLTHNLEAIRPKILVSLSHPINLKDEISKIEMECIKDALELADGNITKAAKLIGIDRKTFRIKNKEFINSWGNAVLVDIKSL